jgi:hypothetical protein
VKQMSEEKPSQGGRQRTVQNYTEEEDDGYKKRKSNKIKDEDGVADDHPAQPARKVVKKERSENSSSRAAASQLSQEDEDDNDAFDHDDPEEDLTELETGQIMRVYCQDFMCHSKMTIDFGRHVNFVTGANGSGNENPYCNTDPNPNPYFNLALLKTSLHDYFHAV